MMRKTKIICTLGPASSSDAMLSTLLRGGMDAARFNFSTAAMRAIWPCSKSCARPAGRGDLRSHHSWTPKARKSVSAHLQTDLSLWLPATALP